MNVGACDGAEELVTFRTGTDLDETTIEAALAVAPTAVAATTPMERKMIVDGLLMKKVEEYGVLKLTEKGEDFIKNQKSFLLSIDRDFSKETITVNKSEKKSFVIDEQLHKILIDLRKTISKDLNKS